MIDAAALSVYWQRLVSIVDEAATALYRTAFSRVVTESKDYTCVLCDERGRLLVQPNQGHPGFLGALATAIGHFARRYPEQELQPGDVLLSNDPYIGTSQLNDLIVVTPVFHGGRVVAYAANVAHSPYVSGRLLSAESREIHEEGLRFPICKLFKAGRPNEELFELIRVNVRVPQVVEGDIYAQHAANEVMARRVVEFLTEMNLPDLREFAEEIFRRSESGMRAAIARMPPGRYPASIRMDGYGDGDGLTLKAAVIIDGDELVVDFAGSDPQTAGSLNCTLNYVYAETVFILMCIVNPSFPVNDGTLRPLRVTAPEGTIVNPRPPAATGARTLVAQYAEALMLRAFADALPERVMAEPAAPSWIPTLSGHDDAGRRFVDLVFLNGGCGARPNSDGLLVGFPSSRASTRAEVLESEKPVLVERNEWITDSCGAGRTRGGPGMSFRIVNTRERPLSVVLRTDRIKNPPGGVLGGSAGSAGQVLHNDRPMLGKETLVLAKNDWVEFRTAGGGGYGDPLKRPREQVLADWRDGLLSAEAATRLYNVDVRSAIP
jgi:N-methylhydantoinase B